ncbi:phage tail tube protein [Paracidovorax wautersii]|uniref:Phage tail tube protein, TTP n=1 Tax=Paracidovorax wautersii TaxID=1177982 RepID=A0A1I2E6Z9_9BURK|nr:phage tail tube protein [Paracidovorax wautersii]SFE88754.1 Phage tail tube protein, TTP [Paracidovorax wautersii]
MSKPIFWKNVSVRVQTALSAAVAIASVTHAAEGVLTFADNAPAGLQDGSYVLLNTVGMDELNDRVIRVKGLDAAAKTFTLERENTTDYEELLSGSIQVVTFGAAFASVQTIAASGGEVDWGDVGTIHGGRKKRAPGMISSMSLAMTNLFKPDDPGFIECQKATRSSQTRAILLGFGKQAKMAFNAYPAAPGIPGGDTVVQTTVTLEAQSDPSLYASA